MDYEGLMKESWMLTKKDLGTWIAATLVLIFGSIFIITFAPLSYGYNLMAVKSLKSEEIRLKDILEGFRLKNFFRSWIVVIAMMIPFVLLYVINSVIANIVVFFLFYSITLLILRGYGGIAACKESSRIAINNPVETIIIFVLYGVIVNIGFLALLIGTLVMLPFGEILLTGVTFDLAGEKRINKILIDDNSLQNENNPYENLSE
ncbi:hypothetical protein SAMN04488589_1522 [Methanolobus vulcani]|uniref:Uncharacterized protein n=1 Tax=Methanolobus vulcani TaxID=38026 RepID=A0A7Z7FCR4_9EURY|nr:hypothetical protein [Methanolobus vulcani]SDF85128.1 hypothetical protein SAMN04488589_1522 [Methanolobus vulcani]